MVSAAVNSLYISQHWLNKRHVSSVFAACLYPFQVRYHPPPNTHTPCLTHSILLSKDAGLESHLLIYLQTGWHLKARLTSKVLGFAHQSSHNLTFELIM